MRPEKLEQSEQCQRQWGSTIVVRFTWDVVGTLDSTQNWGATGGLR